MADSAVAESEEQGGGKGKLLLFLAPVLFLGLGGAAGFLGLWSPQTMFSEPAVKKDEFKHEFVFVDLPPIVLTLAGAQIRSLVLAVKIETRPEHLEQITYLQPRIIDAFNTFLAEVDPQAFERRGVLDVIRNELSTRLAFVLGADAFNDILITEFRIQ